MCFVYAAVALLTTQTNHSKIGNTILPTPIVAPTAIHQLHCCPSCHHRSSRAAAHPPLSNRANAVHCDCTTPPSILTATPPSISCHLPLCRFLLELELALATLMLATLALVAAARGQRDGSAHKRETHRAFFGLWRWRGANA